jgi:hypothetical protein
LNFVARTIPPVDEIYSLYVRLGIDIHLYVPDSSFEVFWMYSPNGALHIEDLARHGHASIEKRDHEEYLQQIIPRVVNVDEEIESCVDLS